MATLAQMDMVCKQDRELVYELCRQLYAQPRYHTYLHDVDVCKERWENMEKIEGYPQIDWPLEVLDFFPPPGGLHGWTKTMSPQDIVLPEFQTEPEPPPGKRSPKMVKDLKLEQRIAYNESFSNLMKEVIARKAAVKENDNIRRGKSGGPPRRRSGFAPRALQPPRSLLLPSPRKPE